jgi:hypothetical protein
VRGAYQVPACWLARVAELVVGGEDDEDLARVGHFEAVKLSVCKRVG